MKKTRTILWGILLVTIGVLASLKILGVVDFDVFFDGWWTLFIIVPSVIGIFTDREKLWAIIGTIVGVILLLSKQDVIDNDAIFKLIIPVIIVLVGLRMIFREFFSKDLNKAKEKINQSGEPVKEYAAVFSGQNYDFSGQVFTSAEFNAVFGGIDCDLRNATITDGAVIKLTAVFGGIDILVPPDVNVKITSNSVFGGMDDKRTTRPADGGVTLFVTGSCIFGGADIK